MNKQKQMQTASKTPVQLIQELIAIHTVRKEAAERLSATASSPERLHAAKTQSEQFTAALLNELSAFGDAVSADTDRNNTYIKPWNDALTTIDTITPQQSSSLFTAMETILQNIYAAIQAEETDLPAPLRQLLDKQCKELAIVD